MKQLKGKEGKRMIPPINEKEFLVGSIERTNQKEKKIQKENGFRPEYKSYDKIQKFGNLLHFLFFFSFFSNFATSALTQLCVYVRRISWLFRNLNLIFLA